MLNTLIFIAIVLAMREQMRDEQKYRISKCKSIRESVARFVIWYLLGSLALKGPQREILRYQFRMK